MERTLPPNGPMGCQSDPRAAPARAKSRKKRMMKNEQGSLVTALPHCYISGRPLARAAEPAHVLRVKNLCGTHDAGHRFAGGDQPDFNAAVLAARIVAIDAGAGGTGETRGILVFRCGGADGTGLDAAGF